MNNELAAQSELRRNPYDVNALHDLANIALKNGFAEQAMVFCKRALSVDDSQAHLWSVYALASIRAHEFARAQYCISAALELKPDELTFHQLQIALFENTHQFAEALQYCLALATSRLHVHFSPEFWVQLHSKIATLMAYVGQSKRAKAYLINCLETAPHEAEYYFRLAEMKDYCFTAQAEQSMQVALSKPHISKSSRIKLHFALARCFENRQFYSGALDQYHHGNQLYASGIDKLSTSTQCQELQQIAQLYTHHRISICGIPQSVTPIFIVGLPRSGSTLLASLLARHSQIGNALELTSLAHVVRQLEVFATRKSRSIGQVLDHETAEVWTKFGNSYLRASAHAVGETTYFIDKMPGNFRHVGLIHKILPNALIIDIRKSPISAALSHYKQLFLEGYEYSYDINDFADFYNEYETLMDHWHSLMPGKIETVSFESLVQDSDAVVQRLLQRLGLSSELQPLDGAARNIFATASSEQIKQPVDPDAATQWKRFMPHIKTLMQPLVEKDLVEQKEFE